MSLIGKIVTQDLGEIIKMEVVHEARPTADDKSTLNGYDVTLFFHIKKEFLSEKIPGKKLEDFNGLEDIILILAKEKEMGSYFHNTKGSAYGAFYREHGTGKVEMKHEEYWIDGKRVVEEDKIKKLVFDSNFNDKADKLING